MAAEVVRCPVQSVFALLSSGPTPTVAVVVPGGESQKGAEFAAMVAEAVPTAMPSDPEEGEPAVAAGTVIPAFWPPPPQPRPPADTVEPVLEAEVQVTATRNPPMEASVPGEPQPAPLRAASLPAAVPAEITEAAAFVVPLSSAPAASTGPDAVVAEPAEVSFRPLPSPEPTVEPRARRAGTTAVLATEPAPASATVHRTRTSLMQLAEAAAAPVSAPVETSRPQPAPDPALLASVDWPVAPDQPRDPPPAATVAHDDSAHIPRPPVPAASAQQIAPVDRLPMQLPPDESLRMVLPPVSAPVPAAASPVPVAPTLNWVTGTVAEVPRSDASPVVPPPVASRPDHTTATTPIIAPVPDSAPTDAPPELARLAVDPKQTGFQPALTASDHRSEDARVPPAVATGAPTTPAPPSPGAPVRPPLPAWLELAELDQPAEPKIPILSPAAPQTSASVPGTTAAVPPAPVQLAQQVLQGLARHQDGTTEITLSPQELGTVRLRLRPDSRDAERMVVLLTFDRPETLDLFRRHADQLAEAIRSAGYSGVDIGFDQGPGPDSGQAEGTDRPPNEQQELSAPAATRPPLRLQAGATLDLRL